MNNIRRNHPPAFKAQVVLALLKSVCFLLREKTQVSVEDTYLMNEMESSLITKELKDS